MVEEDYKDAKYLMRNVLDEGTPTAASVKYTEESMKDYCISAPPMLFNLSYRIEEDFFEDPPSKIQPQFYSPQKHSVQEEEDNLRNMRKFSLQPGEYNSFEYFPVPCPMLPREQGVMCHIANVCAWAKDQHGSRQVQDDLEYGSQFLRNQIFQQILTQSAQLMLDKFGNYVVQKLFDTCSQMQKARLVHCVMADFMDLCLHCFGCRVVQKLIQHTCCDVQAIQEVIHRIQSNCMAILTNPNGNHVIQKCFEVVQQDHLGNILQLLSDNLLDLSFHSYGCRVVQKYIECGQDRSRVCGILNRLIEISFDLAQCQFGNYIIQFMAVHCRSECGKAIEEVVARNFVELSRNKYASNVIEKVIDAAGGEYRDALAQMMVDRDELKALSMHQYANYVVQSIIRNASRDKKILLKKGLKDHCSEISKTQYGRHVLMQLDKIK